MNKRATIQLKKIKELLIEGYQSYYWIVLLNPKTEQIITQKRKFRIYKKLCILVKKLGLRIIYSHTIWSETTGFSISPPKELNI